MAVAVKRQSFALRQVRWRTVWTVLVATFWCCIVVGIVGGFFLNWGWTGFKGNGTLWDWLGLLSAPVFASALPFLFRGPAAKSEDQGDSQSAERAHALEDQRQQAALETYHDYMLELLLNKNLLSSPTGSDVREVARARTLTALRRVGGKRKRDVLQFLHEAGLISKGNPVVDLRGADLRDADLSAMRLVDAHLRGVDLSGANLDRADLSGTDLSGANLDSGQARIANGSEATAIERVP
jgi:hypothetical protein